jgi:hypothetical protein
LSVRTVWFQWLTKFRKRAKIHKEDSLACDPLRSVTASASL